MPAPSPVLDCLRRYWGFDALRPLQREAIDATLAGRDSLTVLPTGGGKSLCYQLPPMISGRWTLVVSPLIALMQDQVAALTSAGVPAAAMHSMAEREAGDEARRGVEEGRLRLLLAAPERVLTDSFRGWLGRCAQKRKGPGAIAIDEAHCISQWGHDFRPEYRRLAELRQILPGTPIGAYTATATPRVRRDIIDQLGLRAAAELVGDFDRPNLTYRVLPRVDVAKQTAEALRRHEGRAAIVYCISRKDTESLAAALVAMGFDAAPYHAGMTPVKRTRTSDAFRREQLQVVVATVAFGMGIDRGDVRCVVHAAMPKSVEHYQQETGRAGRDGLPAECVMLYSSADAVRWRQLLQGGPTDPDEPFDPAAARAQLELLDHMQRLAGSARCRHRALVEYFGQRLAGDNCGACDVCLGELAPIADAQDVARKILSCVFRCEQRFGAAHIAEVLMGARTEKIRQLGHDAVSTWGLLRGLSKAQITNYIGQLVDDGRLERVGEQYPVLRLAAGAWPVLRNEARATLVEARIDDARPGRRAKPSQTRTPLTDDEQRLFEALRAWRRRFAEERAVPPFVIMGDATLEDLCRARPSTPEALAGVRGIGARKLADLGPLLLPELARACAGLGLALNARTPLPPEQGPSEPARLSAGASAARELFRGGMSVEEVCAKMGRARSTVMDYLAGFVQGDRPESIDRWVDPGTQRRVAEAAETCGGGRLRPIFEHLAGAVPYDQIRIVLAHRRGKGARGPEVE
ncbi:MAG: RecQ family ATP-dependent DNA helicase [Phycisphaerae bacterium]|nr:RecQ family ATP-dependent DNA helicase [Phycisphaerae bacterium]